MTFRGIPYSSAKISAKALGSSRIPWRSWMMSVGLLMSTGLHPAAKVWVLLHLVSPAFPTISTCLPEQRKRNKWQTVCLVVCQRSNSVQRTQFEFQNGRPRHTQLLWLKFPAWDGENMRELHKLHGRLRQKQRERWLGQSLHKCKKIAAALPA